MADLPRIFAEPNVRAYQAPHVSPMSFGYGFAKHLQVVAGELAHQKQTQDLVSAQLALDKRDEIYQQQRLAMRLNPGAMGDMPADEFIKKWNDKAQQDDQALLGTLNPEVRKQAGVLFARLQRKEFDNQFTDYRNVWTDQQRSRLEQSWNDDEKRLAGMLPGPEYDFYKTQLNASKDAAASSGLFHYQEIQKNKQDTDSRIQAVQADNLMLDKEHGGPQQVLANLRDSNMWPDLKPDKRAQLMDTATRVARMNENEAIKNQKAQQDGRFRVYSKLAERPDGGLSAEMIQDAEASGDIRPEQSRFLMHQLGAPTYAVSPGAINQIERSRLDRGLSVGSNNQAIKELQKLDPHDPNVTRAIEHLQNMNRILSRPGPQGLHITQAVREFKDANYSGKQTVLQHFSLPGLNFQRQQVYNNAINHIEAEMGRGVPKEKAMREALDMVRPKAGGAKSAGQDVQEYIGE